MGGIDASPKSPSFRLIVDPSWGSLQGSAKSLEHRRSRPTLAKLRSAPYRRPISLSSKISPEPTRARFSNSVFKLGSGTRCSNSDLELQTSPCSQGHEPKPAYHEGHQYRVRPDLHGLFGRLDHQTAADLENRQREEELGSDAADRAPAGLWVRGGPLGLRQGVGGRPVGYVYGCIQGKQALRGRMLYCMCCSLPVQISHSMLANLEQPQIHVHNLSQLSVGTARSSTCLCSITDPEHSSASVDTPKL